MQELTVKSISFPVCPTAAPTNIYIQGLDTVTQLSSEIRVLKEENLSLQSRLQASRGKSTHLGV